MTTTERNTFVMRPRPLAELLGVRKINKHIYFFSLGFVIISLHNRPVLHFWYEQFLQNKMANAKNKNESDEARKYKRWQCSKTRNKHGTWTLSNHTLPVTGLCTEAVAIVDFSAGPVRQCAARSGTIRFRRMAACCRWSRVPVSRARPLGSSRDSSDLGHQWRMRRSGRSRCSSEAKRRKLTFYSIMKFEKKKKKFLENK